MAGACCGGWRDPFRLDAIQGTNREDTRSTAMTRDMDAPANELRDEASRAKRAASGSPIQRQKAGRRRLQRTATPRP
jgi:hypothetical protein